MNWISIADVYLTGGETLTLRQSGDVFEIRLGLYQLMASGNSVSERVLASITCAGCCDGTVLIGGLGLGYTVRAVLDTVGPDARVTVAELVPQIVDWNRGLLAHLAGRPLDDPRVEVMVADVADIVRARPGGFDAILLDVDNGPDAVLFQGNSFLYTADGVRLLLSGLKPGGVLAVWAATPSPAFEKVLETCGFPYRRRTVAVLERLTHTIYLVGR